MKKLLLSLLMLSAFGTVLASAYVGLTPAEVDRYVELQDKMNKNTASFTDREKMTYLLLLNSVLDEKETEKQGKYLKLVGQARTKNDIRELYNKYVAGSI